MKEEKKDKTPEICSPDILNLKDTERQPKDTPDKYAGQPVKESSYFGETLRFFILAVLVVVPIRLFVVHPFLVEGSSMDPTFAGGQYIIVDGISYRFKEPARGDVIVLQNPTHQKIFNIKRLVGLPGETLVIKKGVVSITNKDNLTPFILNEPYIRYRQIDGKDIKITLGADEFFVMGDNRPVSSDSRTWGVLPRDLVVGRTILRLFPLSTATFFPGFPE